MRAPSRKIARLGARRKGPAASKPKSGYLLGHQLNRSHNVIKRYGTDFLPNYKRSFKIYWQVFGLC